MSDVKRLGEANISIDEGVRASLEAFDMTLECSQFECIIFIDNSVEATV